MLRGIVNVRRADMDAKVIEHKFFDTDASRLRSVYEVLPELAETRPEIGFVRRAIAAIRKFLRELGLSLALTDNDIIGNFILPARRFVEQGRNRSSKTSAPKIGDAQPAFTLSPPESFTTSGVDPFRDFVLLDGNKDLARFPADAEKATRGELQALPIRLPVGKHFGRNRGFGLAHIEAEHGKEIRASGMTPEQYVAGILNSATKIYAGDGTRVTVLSEKAPAGSAFIELRNDGRYYSVVTAFKTPPKGKLIWSGRNGALSTEGSRPSIPKDAAATTGQSVNPSAQNADGVTKPNPTAEALAAKISTESMPTQADEDNEVSFSLATPAAANVMQDIRDRFATFNDTRKTFNGWWHKTVGTQYHKAQIDSDYKKVFDRSQQYLTDVSRYALSAADLAQDILPRFEKLSDLTKSGASPRELAPVAEAIFRGTLDDERVYSDAELVSRYKLNPKQIRLYRQARAAIERSLDDMAITEAVKLIRPEISEKMAQQAASLPSEGEQWRSAAQGFNRCSTVAVEGDADQHLPFARRQLIGARMKLRKICGAHARSTGLGCRAGAMVNGRCKLHGGMSTGPRSQAGKTRALANLRQHRS